MTENSPIIGGRKNITMAVLAYILFFVPLLTGDAKKDSFVKYHTKQGLVLFLFALLLNVIGYIFPYYFLWQFVWIFKMGVIVLLVVGIINAANGKQQPLPLIGQFSDRFKF